MNKWLNKIVDLYLFIVLVTFIVTIITTIALIKYTKDIQHKEAFVKITCDHIFYGKLNNIERNKEWYCGIKDREFYMIALTGSMWPKIAVFNDNAVWLNKETHRAYKYTEGESIVDRIQERIIYCYLLLLALVALSVFTVYNS